MSNLSTNGATQPNVATALPETPPDVRWSLSDVEVADSQQFEMMTNNVIGTCREVVKIAQDLEALVLQNAARVKAARAEYIKLVDSVGTRATQLGEMIGELAQTALRQTDQTH